MSGHPDDKPLVWLYGEIKTPPFSNKARQEAGLLLREIQQGVPLSMPHSRNMNTIADGAHELRITDEGNVKWRIIYYIDDDAILILEVFKKKTGETPESVKEVCRKRLYAYRQAQK
jgi:phage-related protein